MDSFLRCLLLMLLPCFLLASEVYQFECPLDSGRIQINGTYADPDNCQLYYLCYRGLKWTRQCPPGLHYWPITIGELCSFRMCVYPDESECVNTDEARAAAKYELVREELEVHQLAMDEQQNPTYPCFKDESGEWVDVTLPNRHNCYQFYHCVKGESYPEECPPYSYFTPVLGWHGPDEGCHFDCCHDYEDAMCAIHGDWGNWGGWAACSVPCGDGVQFRYRECDNPPPANTGDDCPGYNFDPRVCNEGPCKDNGTAVYVYRVTDLSTGDTELDPVDFEGVLVNTDGSYNYNADTFTALSSGFYFHTLGAGVLALQPGHMYLKNTNAGTDFPPIGIHRSHTYHVGRDGGISNVAIMYMSQGDTVNLAAAPQTSLTADAGKPTYWGIFEIGDIGGSTPSIFSVAYDRSEDNPTLPLQFDYIMVNEGTHYDPATGIFAPTTSGIYLLSMSAAVENTNATRNIDFTMSCSGSCDSTTTLLTKLTRNHDNYKGIDGMSRFVLMGLDVGSEISVHSNAPFYSSDHLQTSFSGFLYDPVPEKSIAFFVARTNSWSDSVALDPVNFNRGVLNVGGGWGADGLDNYFVAPLFGYYFIFVSAGTLTNQRVDMRLYKNDEYTADVYRQSQQHEGNDQLSRSIILYLEQGDRLRLRAIANTAFYSSDIGHETSFGGFLLFQEQDANVNTEELLKQFKL